MVDDLVVLVWSADRLAATGIAAQIGDRVRTVVAAGVDADPAGLATRHGADVLLIDVGVADGSLPVLQEVRHEQGSPVLALCEEPATLTRDGGAGGAISRDADGAAIFAAVRAAAAGLWVESTDPAGTPVGPARRDSVDAGAPSLTPREIEVLEQVARGLPNKGIAFALGISEHTVKFHLTGVLGKLGAASRTEAVVMATRLGLLTL